MGKFSQKRSKKKKKRRGWQKKTVKKDVFG